MGEVHPGEIVTSRAPLEAFDERPSRAARPPERSRRVSQRPEWLFHASLAAIFVAFGAAIVMDKEGRELPRALVSNPFVIAELHPNISEVIEQAPQDGALEITLVEAAPMYPSSVMAGFASDALVVLRRMHEFFPQTQNRVVRFVVKAPLHPVDPDASTLAPVLSLDFERSEVMPKAIAPEFTFQDLLNETTAVEYLNDESGPRYVGAFCRDPLSSSAMNFCERERGGG